MAGPTDVLTVQLTDSFGDVGMFRGRVLPATGDASLLDLVEAVEASSALKLQSAQRTQSRPLLGAAALAYPANPYADDRDSLILSFGVTLTGQHVYLSIPGPLAATIDGDDGKIDPTDARWDTLKAAVAAIMVTQQGVEVDGDLERGVLNKSRIPRSA